MDELKALLMDVLTPEKFAELNLSNSQKPSELSRVKLRPLLLHGKQMIQGVKFCGNQVFHTNMTYEEAQEYVLDLLSSTFKQCEMTANQQCYTILTNHRGTVTIKKRNQIIAKSVSVVQVPTQAHNRSKHYIIADNTDVPYLMALGVMNAAGQVYKKHYDKFRQINHFLEYIRDVLPQLPKDRKLNIIDFGCGKSYLTFAMYDYLKLREGYDVTITGLDLKARVIADCEALARRLGYTDLHFVCGKIEDYNATAPVDMVVDLHACDLSTDYALHKAIQWGTKVILSVPCCQHELNEQISCEPLSDILEYGLIRERTCALFTDAIRAKLLEACGYRTQVLEYIDLENTPKNILIRAVYTGRQTIKKQEIDQLCDFLHIQPTLRTLLEDKLSN